MGKYFGTDGFRGEAGKDLTAEQAFRIGMILASIFGKNGRRPRAVIGKDTRRSGYMLEYAVASGLAAAGADAHILHVCTTPSVSYAVGTDGFDLGIMISASHNRYTDNGIKIVDGTGAKIGDEITERIEALMDKDDPPASVTGADIGRIVDWYEGRNRYIGYLISLAKHSYKGLKIGLDCANGGAFMIAKAVFEALGAEVKTIGTSPDGLNINEGCGSTHPEKLCELVKQERLDLGFAFDGDADRCIAIDERARVVDGDGILYILANGMRERGELKNDTVVTTVMSNGGLWRALCDKGMRYEVTSVGDRFVYEKIKEGGYSLGGEQSGHIIMTKYATTGDGILTAIMLTEEIRERNTSLSSLVRELVPMPQITKNIRVADKKRAISSPVLSEAVKKAEEELSKRGRLILRESGTEQVIRLTVECDSMELCERLSEGLTNIISEAGG